ncbi:MAG: response regulator transcription factor [Burkholderiaceae bacterium]|nr:response regulator transcription factor [Burkholderiaceae bacterium]
MNAKAIRVVLVDDHAMVRNGVRLMLASAGDIEVVGESGNAQEAIAMLKEITADVVLLDISMPGKNGLDLLKQLRGDYPKLAVLVLSTYSEEIYAVRALKLGAAGYLTKDSPTDVLVAAVRKAAGGGRYVSETIADKLADMVGGGKGASHEDLSNRELEVLKQIARGEALVKIAENLHLSPNTVTTYRARIMEKMDLHSNAELTRYAIEHGLLS